MQTYIQLEGFVKSNNEAVEVVVQYLVEKYKMEKEEVKKIHRWRYCQSR